MNTAVRKRLLAARQWLANNKSCALVARVIYHVPLIEDPSKGPSMCTNGYQVFYNPDFVEKCKDQELCAVLYHEYWHILAKHSYRVQTLIDSGCKVSMRVANLAADAVINPIVGEVAPLPGTPFNPFDPTCAPTMWGHVRIAEVEGMTFERACRHLMREEEEQAKKGKPQKGQGNGQPQPGQQRQGEEEGQTDEPTPGGMPTDDVRLPETEEEKQALEEFVREVIEQAVHIGRAKQEMTRRMEQALAPEPKRRRSLSELVQDMVGDAQNQEDATWAIPNRRFIGQGILRPGRRRDVTNRVAVAVDVSGSMSHEAVSACVHAAASLLEDGLVQEAYCYAVNTAIVDRETVQDADALREWGRKLQSGGGTHFDSAMAEIARIDDCNGLVFLTDLGTHNYGKQPPFPVAWVDWEGTMPEPPFGRRIKLWDHEGDEGQSHG